MSTNPDYETWGRKLDTGHTDDDLLNLAADLHENPLPADTMPATAKEALRQRLIAQHPQTKPTIFGWLRSALGTAVALTALAAVVVFAWMSFGSQPGLGAAVSVTREVKPTPLPTSNPTDAAPIMQIVNYVDVNFGDTVTLNTISLAEPPLLPGDTLGGSLSWTRQADTDLTVALYIFTDDNQLVAQTDVAMPSSSGRQFFQLPLPADLPPAVYDLQISVYDTATQTRLATEAGETAVFLASITVETLPAESQNTITIQQVTIGANTGFITDQQTMTVTMDVNLIMIEAGTAVAKLLVREGPDLMRGVASSSAAVSTGDSTVTVAIPLTGLEVQPPATLVLAAELYADTAPVDDASGPPLATYTEPFFQWRYDPSATGTDTAALLEAVQLQRHTAVVTFEVRVATHVVSGDTAVLQMYLANPNWEDNWEISDSLRLTFTPEDNWEISDSLRLNFTPSATNPGAMQLTTTPEEIRTATATDNPILVVEMWPRSSGDSSELTAIAPLRFTFPECPMDLTRQDEVVCLP